MGLELENLKSIFTQIANLAANQSLVVGELPALTQFEAENLLGEFGLLGAVVQFGDPEANYGR